MTVNASIPFFKAREHFSLVESGGEASSISRVEVVPIDIEDIRGNERSLTFEELGLEVLNFRTTLDRHDFRDQALVESTYCRELAESILERLGGQSIQVFEAQVRRREPSFPSLVSDPIGQPALRPHIDISHEQALVKLAVLNPDTVPPAKWIYVNAWKPLRGPLRDWPLTLCHPATLDVTDAIRMSHDTEGHLNENMHIIYRAGQRWVYLSDQRDDEVWLFRQASSDGRPGIAHGSFQVPEDKRGGECRESVEVRAFVYF